MIKTFLDKLKSYIEISNFERRGLFSLLFILAIISSYYYYQNTYSNSIDVVNQKKLENLKASIENSISENKKYDFKDARPEKKFDPKPEVVLLPFNPNDGDFKALLQKGIPYKVVKNIINYRNSGGEFKSKEDVAKLYSVDSELFLQLNDYIQLPDTISGQSSVYNDRKTKVLQRETITPVVVNTATESELVTIKGIGVTYAKRIIERREKLGGFYTADQLNEVYGMSKETVDKITPYLVFSPDKIRTLHLNSATYEELAIHPYLSYGEAKGIVNYRTQHGDFIDARDLKKLHIFRGKDVDRILPYLDLN